jgi:5-methylcytosine-specific restriction endonuclease McrA
MNRMQRERLSEAEILIGRSVPEWVGKTPDAAIPARVKLRVWERCNGRCALTGKKIMPGDAHDYDHIIPLGLGGEHREGNLQLVSAEAHKQKTRADVDMIAKAKRISLKHTGNWPKSKTPLKSRGFPKSRRAVAVHDETDEASLHDNASSKNQNMLERGVK